MTEDRSPEEELEEERDDAVIGVALRYSVVALGLIVAAVGAVLGLKYLQKPIEIVVQPKPIGLPTVRSEVEQELPKLLMKDITDEAGIRFVHTNGAAGEKLLPESMGGGCAFLDYDRDGDADILFVNSRKWSYPSSLYTAQISPEKNRSGADQTLTSTADKSDSTSSLTLYANNGTGTFRDVTDEVGLKDSFYGQGCAIGDFDNDGAPDLFVSAVAERNSSVVTLATNSNDGQPSGPCRLYHNENGKFVDVTQAAGVAGTPKDWSSSCGWFDYDNDGDLDLWVCNYIDWSREFDLAQNFRLTGGERAYGRPQAFGGSYPHLYRNDGSGKFTEASAAAGIRINAATTGTPLAKSLGLTFHDFDRDGKLDVLVANDTVQNNLFHNLGDGTFQEMAALAGVAFDADGNARGAMGLDVGCVRDDPRCACVAIGNFANEMTAFYVSAPGSLVFSDQAVANGIGPSTRLFLTFGVLFLDADLDGWDDLFHANGHLEEDIAKVQASQTYAQSPQLFWNAGPEASTEFVALSKASTSEDFSKPMVGRGAAYADIDGDGDLDILISATGSKPRLLRNDQQLGHHWLRIRLQGNGTTSNRDGIGARVDVELKSGRTISKCVNPTRSYLSQVELPLTFGLGDGEVKSVQVTWPDGKTQGVAIDGVDRLVDVKQANL
jgi:enediyne biosynthesis protein E4